MRVIRLLPFLSIACTQAPRSTVPEPARTPQSLPSLALRSSASAQTIANPYTPPREGWEVSFIAASDFHFGFGNVEASHARLVESVNQIASVRYPPYLAKSVGHAEVGAVRGLIVTGDLTEWGTKPQWELFNQYYGANGRVSVPVFEVIGNHDRASGTYVDEQVAARHGSQRYYSFHWEGLHMVALNEAPGDEGLDFLERDLNALPAGVPILVYFHLALAGPWSKGWWFLDGGYPDRLEKILRGHNVAGIFHGHHHVTEHYMWRGFDVYKPGPVKDGNGVFSIVHVNAQSMTVASYNYMVGGFVGAHVKPLSTDRKRTSAL
jgi:predicted MPP superfamily phosphohydrolase